MGFVNLISKKKKFTFVEVGLDEIAVLAFTLLIVKYVPILTYLDWYWYVVVIALAGYLPVKTALKN